METQSGANPSFASNQNLATPIWQQFPKIVITLYLKNKELQINKQICQALEQVQKKHASRVDAILTQVLTNSFSDAHEPILVVNEKKTSEILAQVLNFTDTIGGKAQISAENIEKFLIMRGILQPSQDLSQLLRTQKERESYQFVTSSSHNAGEEFQLDEDELNRIQRNMAEMDSNVEIKLQPEGFKYKATIQQVFKEVQDPFGKEDSMNDEKFAALEAASTAEGGN